jgi:catalase
MGIVYFKQAGERYLDMNKKERDSLIGNIVQSLMFVDEDIQKKVVGHFKNANGEMGARIERELFLEV